MLFRTKTAMVSEADALPGRTDQTMPVPATHHVNGAPPAGPVARGLPDRRVRPRLLLGRREAVLGDARRVVDRRRLRRWLHPEPHVRGGVLRAHRPLRGRARRVRSRRRHLRAAAQGVLGGPRSHPGHAPGQRPRHPVPQRPVHHRRRPAGRVAEATRATFQEALSAPVTARSRPRSPRSATSSTPSRTTSSTWPRTRAATARSTPPA